MLFYKNSFILILIKNNKLTISYKDNKDLIFKYYDKENIVDNIKFNILYLANIIKNFISINKINNKNLIIVLEDNSIYQNLSKELEKINREDYFINNENIDIGDKKLIYQVAIKNSQVFQYNLMSFLANLKLICLTTEFICWYYFYKFNLFKPSNNRIKKLDNLNDLKESFKNLFFEKIDVLVKDWPKDILKNIDRDNLITIIGAHNLID